LNSSDQDGVKIPAVVLFAPTATGKTALLRTLFAQSSHSFFKGRAEIISADSMQVYRGMNIGTAKPGAALLSELPHHLIDIRSPKEQFSVADFVELADKACLDVYERGNIPVVAGGTGFYIRSFLLGLPDTPASDAGVRSRLKRRMETEGPAVLYAELRRLDPQSAAVIHPHDAYRIQRALEVYEETGTPRSAFLLSRELRSRYSFCTIILSMERGQLYERINERVRCMFAEGLEREVRQLAAAGCTASDPGMRAIGYREWFEDDAADRILLRIQAASRAYAKKQYTFMSAIPGAHTVLFDGSDAAVQTAAEYIRTLTDRR